MVWDWRRKKCWFFVGCFVAFWTGIALLTAAQDHTAQALFDKPVSWELAIRRAFKEWYAYGFVSIGVLWLCARLQPEPGKMARWVGWHLLASVGFCLADITLYSWLLSGETSVQTGEVLTFGYLFKKWAIHYIVPNLLIY